MLTCHASGLNRARVRAWFGGNAPGFIDLYRKTSGGNVFVASNPSAAVDFDYKVEPEVEEVKLFLRVAPQSIGSEAQSLYFEISQNDVILPIRDENGTVNGGGPFTVLKLTPEAPHNLWKRYYFNVRFS